MRGGFQTALPNSSVKNGSVDLDASRDLRSFFNDWYLQRQRFGEVSGEEAAEMQACLLANMTGNSLDRFLSDVFDDNGEAA